MDFFNKIGKKASETYKVTAEKTGKLAKEAKLRMKMNENKAEIEELYAEIGKKVYEKHTRKDNLDIKENLEEECIKIDVLSAEIETTLKECLKLKDKKQCENCYAEIEKTAQYCSNCGAKQDEVNEPEEIEYEDKDAKSTNNKQEVIEVEAVSDEDEFEQSNTEENTKKEINNDLNK